MNWIFTLLHTNSRCYLYPIPRRYREAEKVVYLGRDLTTVITAPFQKEGHLFNKHLLRACSNG